MKIKYSSKPVVVAPFGMTLGGGAEVCLPAVHIQASMETYMGLVETGVGLIPGGGGNKELYIRHLKANPEGYEVDLQKVANKVFEQIALAKVSTSGVKAKENHYLNLTDGISVNHDHLLYDAKQAVLDYIKRVSSSCPRLQMTVVGETGYATLLFAAKSMKDSGYISDYDFYDCQKISLLYRRWFHSVWFNSGRTILTKP